MEEGSSSCYEQCLLESILDGKEKPTNLSLALLQKITNDFSEESKIGQGGFGAVYKGVFGERIVAVKKIEKIDIYDKLFDREFNCLWVINHENVVRFLGFCSSTCKKAVEKDGIPIFAEVRERLFCFEYVSGGSLYKRITDELRGLEWETRFEIITGICKGLCYLHNKTKIIHMDLKPANILLDGKNMVPKITDFGLSRPNTNSHTMAQPIGTLGYIAPEYRENSKTTAACDIYSLGAIIMELVTGGMEVPNKHNVLRRWRHRWKKQPTPLQYRQIIRCIEIAGCCREQKPEGRPSIEKIIVLLSESTNGQTGQEISTYMDDDMLGIEPLELHFNKEMSWSVMLTNKTKAYFAFKIESQSNQYTMGPEKGIVPPGSESIVRIEVGASQVTENGDKFIVWSTKVSEGLTAEHITEHTFHEDAGKVVDEVHLLVVHEPTKVQQKFRSREDTNLSAEEVPEAKRRKSPESPSGKGKTRLGSSEKEEASSMDISSSAQGHCTNLLDRRNFHPPESFSHSQATNMTYLVRPSDRAIDVTRGAMGSLLHKLGVLVHKEYKLETSIKEDAVDLVNMQQLLRKVSEVKQDNLDDTVKLWASNVRDMSYDLEDFVDGFLVHSGPASDVSDFTELTHQMYLDKGKSHQSIGDLIKHHFRKQVQDAAQNGKMYEVDNIVPNASTKADIEDPRISSIYIDREQLIGIEAPKEELTSLLEDGNNRSKLKIVSVVGLGGLGKTTLTQAVYDGIKAQYETRAFLTVGQNPDVQRVLKDIIYELDDNFNAANLDVRKLQTKVKKLLDNRRYFIVIDDIWGSLEWNGIRPAFPENKNGSRLMITTRDRNVALACCNYESKYVHEIKPLSEEDSKTLFFRRIFGSRKDCYVTPRKEDISKYILKRCRGMPLAINSIASLLAVGKDSSWEYVLKSLGALIEVNDGLNNMKQILNLSYIQLPDHLKSCLLYVCMYPEDREIYKIELLRKWVAEGFVHVSRNGVLDAEDVAEQYFEVLINMCLIQPDKIDYNNEVLSCRVHDIILELMRSKSSEANFIQVIDGLQDASRPRGEIRRVSVQDKDREDGRILETIKGSLSHARSVLVYRRSIFPDFLKYKYVRVLHLDDQAYSKEPLDLTGIGCLFFLRYLKISCILFGRGLKLPDQIGHLQQLETIDLTGNLENYPSDIVTLPWLSHLRFCAPYDIMLPDGIERLKSLHTLKGVWVSKCLVENIKGLGELTNLRELEVYWDSNSESKEVASVRMNALHSSISRLSTSLRTLTLNHFIDRPPDIGSCSGTLFPQGSPIRKLNLGRSSFERCPEWMGQLHYLYSLTITVTEVAECFTTVGGLPSLVHFQFFADHRREKEESVVISGSGAFQALKHLIVNSRMTSFTFEEGAMTKLEKLDMPLQYNIVRRLAYRRVGIHHLPAATLKAISLNVWVISDDWKVKGSEHWNDRDWDIYWESNHYRDKIKELTRKTVPMLKRAFKLHHPSAYISIDFVGYRYLDSDYVDEGDYEEDGDEQHDEDAYDDEDFCMEDYMTEEDDESVDDEEEYNNNDGTLVNTVAHLNQAATGGRVGIAASAASVRPQAKAVDGYHGENIFWDNLMPDSCKGAEDKDDDPSQDVFWQSMLTDPEDDQVEAAVG